MRPPMTGKFFEIPIGYSMSWLMASCGFSAFAVWANKAAFNVAPASLAPGFVAEAAEKEGVAERISAPAVFLNPIRRNIPGNMLGPGDA